MKKYLLLFALLLTSAATHLLAQCTMGYTGTAGGSAGTNSQYNSIIQTFKPTCSGNLSSIVAGPFTPISDDFRGSLYYVAARIRSADGTILATSARTDQIYPNGPAVTFDFTCNNVYLTSGTTYQMELYETSNTVGMINVLLRTTSSQYADGNAILNGTSYPASDIRNLQAVVVSTSLASANATKTQDVSCGLFTNASSQIIAQVSPGTISGSTTTKLFFESAQPAQFVTRHYEIAPASNGSTATGTVTLYFTQAEFDAFNAVNSLKLPTGPSDNAGIGRLLIERRIGTSSNNTGLPTTYVGTGQNVTPTSVVWNAAASRWEVIFSTTGFGGFFVKTQTGAISANTAPVATANTNQTATVGTAFSYTANAFTDAETPGSLTYTASISPANGLSFNPSTRVISGTPTATSPSSVTIVATDPGSLSASTTFTITAICSTITAVLTGTTTICRNGATNLSTTLSGGTGPYSLTYSTGTSTSVVSGNTLTFAVSPTASTTYTIVALRDANGCSATTSGSAVVTVSQPPTPSMAGASQTITAGSSAALTANTPTTGTGSWSVTSGPSTSTAQFSSATNSTATFTPAGGVGNYVLTWTIANAPCAPSASSVTITVSPPLPIRYVTQNGTGDGSSWASASGNLQAMIDTPGVEQVWVAGGTYKPTTGTDRSVSFVMKNNVAIYGGFFGTEANLNDRPAVNPILGTPSSTTLSGDIGTPNDNSDNSYHVIVNDGNSLTNRAILDGVVIAGGNANGPVTGPDSNGGGIYNSSSSPTITNCSLINNSASSNGGGIGNFNSSSPKLTNCSLQTNSALNGGGVFNSDGSPTFTNCSLINNSASSKGGGIYSTFSSPMLASCSLINNSAANGGGIANEFNGNLTLVNCSLQNNSATNGGGIFNMASNPMLTNCSLLNNSATVDGGGIYNTGVSNPILANCVLWGNGANKTIYNDDGGDGSPSALTATYSLFDNTVTGYTGTNNLTTTTSPFASANPGTLAGVALAPNSPAINAGSNAAYEKGPETDLVGNLRIFPTGGTIDMGAIELQSTPVTLSTLSVSPNPVCAGGVLSVTATVGNTTGSYAYTLTTGSNPVSGTASGAAFSQTLTASGSGNQTLTLTISANAQLVTASTSLTVSELPTPGLTANFAGVLTCAQTSLTLTATGGVSYTFANATGNLGTPGPTNTLTVSNAGTYFVQVANASGCTSQTSIIVSSNQTPPALSVSPSSATLTMANPTVNLTASGDGSFRWSTGETSPAISVTASGTYSVTLTSPGGCTASASVPVVGADLTVTLELPQANFAAPGSVGNLVVHVFEVGGLPTSSGNVTITLTAPAGYTLAFAPSQTSIQVSGGSPVAVENGQWTVTNSLAARQLSLTMNSGAFISGGGESRLGFSITRTSATSGSTANITVNVADDLTRTYDGNLSNNVYARVIGGL